MGEIVHIKNACSRNALENGVTQAGDVVFVQVGRGLVERQDAAFRAEGFGESHANNERRKDLEMDT